MFCSGSLMSQVLQCTQFCALICRRLALTPAPSPGGRGESSTNSYTPAGQYLASGPAYFARITLTGTDGALRVRWQGWFSSWLVLEMNTEERRSKVSLPSGFGYSIGPHSEAGLKAS